MTEFMRCTGFIGEEKDIHAEALGRERTRLNVLGFTMGDAELRDTTADMFLAIKAGTSREDALALLNTMVELVERVTWIHGPETSEPKPRA